MSADGTEVLVRNRRIQLTGSVFQFGVEEEIQSKLKGWIYCPALECKVATRIAGC